MFDSLALKVLLFNISGLVQYLFALSMYLYVTQHELRPFWCIPSFLPITAVTGITGRFLCLQVIFTSFRANNRSPLECKNEIRNQTPNGHFLDILNNTDYNRKCVNKYFIVCFNYRLLSSRTNAKHAKRELEFQKAEISRRVLLTRTNY